MESRRVYGKRRATFEILFNPSSSVQAAVRLRKEPHVFSRITYAAQDRHGNSDCYLHSVTRKAFVLATQFVLREVKCT